MSEAAPRITLPEPAYWLLWIVFGACTIAPLHLMQLPDLPLLDRAGIALALSFTATSVLWLFLLALQISTLWSIVLLVPYLNLFAISIFARRYWRRGARAPALLVMGALALELALTLRWLLHPPSPVWL